jgi:hypothetical protein
MKPNDVISMSFPHVVVVGAIHRSLNAKFHYSDFLETNSRRLELVADFLETSPRQIRDSLFRVCLEEVAVVEFGLIARYAAERVAPGKRLQMTSTAIQTHAHAYVTVTNNMQSLNNPLPFVF